MKKILINKSGSEQTIMGRILANNEQYDIPANKWLDLSADMYDEGYIYDGINAETIVVNDGESDLLKQDGLDWCKRLSESPTIENNGISIIEDSKYIDFQGNAKVTRDDKRAVIRIGSESNIGMIYPMSFVKSGSAQNKFMDLQANSIISNYIFGVIPFNSNIVGITYSNYDGGTDCDVQIWKADRNNGNNLNLLYTWQLRDVRIGYKTNVNISVNAGEKIALYLVDQGKDPNDVVITLYLKVLNDNNKEEFIEDFDNAKK